METTSVETLQRKSFRLYNARGGDECQLTYSASAVGICKVYEESLVDTELYSCSEYLGALNMSFDSLRTVTNSCPASSYPPSEISLGFSKTIKHRVISFVNTVESSQTSVSTQTSSDSNDAVPKPLFGDTWQEYHEVTAEGAVLTYSDSDARLEVPPKAVEDGVRTLCVYGRLHRLGLYAPKAPLVRKWIHSKPSRGIACRWQPPVPEVCSAYVASLPASHLLTGQGQGLPGLLVRFGRMDNQGATAGL